MAYHHMKHGQMSHAVRMHNKGRTPEEIGEALGVHPGIVKGYLMQRPGWPGKLLGLSRARRASKIDEDREERQGYVKRAVPSLPKLRFMGEA